MFGALQATAVAAFAATVVAANWLTTTVGMVPIGLGMVVTAGTFAAGAALVLRDGVDRTGGRRWVALSIAVGIVLSYALASPAIAVASAVAFAASELADWAVFSPIRPRSLPAAVLASSVVSAPVDTVLFLALAGFPVTPAAVFGQFVVKTALAALVSIAVVARRRAPLDVWAT